MAILFLSHGFVSQLEPIKTISPQFLKVLPLRHVESVPMDRRFSNKGSGFSEVMREKKRDIIFGMDLFGG